MLPAINLLTYLIFLCYWLPYCPPVVGYTQKVIVGSEVRENSGLPLRLPHPKDFFKKATKNVPYTSCKTLAYTSEWSLGMGRHWYVSSNSCSFHKKISQDGLKPCKKQTWSSWMLKRWWTLGHTMAAVSSVKLRKTMIRRVRYFSFSGPVDDRQKVIIQLEDIKKTCLLLPMFVFDCIYRDGVKKRHAKKPSVLLGFLVYSRNGYFCVGKEQCLVTSQGLRQNHIPWLLQCYFCSNSYLLEKHPNYKHDESHKMWPYL